MRIPTSEAISPRKPHLLTVWPVICIGDSHCLKYTGKRIELSDMSLLHFSPVYISGFSSASLQDRPQLQNPEPFSTKIREKLKAMLGFRSISTNLNPSLDNQKMSEYALDILQSLGALSFDKNGLSQAVSALDTAVAHAKSTPLVSPLVMVTCGDIDLRTKVMRTGLTDSNYRKMIAENFYGLFNFLAELKSRNVNIVLEGLTPPTHDDTIFALHNKFLLPSETRGRVYQDCNSYLRQECKRMGISFLDLSQHFSNSLGCLKEEYEYDGVHLCPSCIEIIVPDLESCFQHSQVNLNRYKTLLKKRSAPFSQKSPVATTISQSARGIFLEKSILVKTFHDPELQALLKAIYAQLEFTHSVANRHYRLDWAGNERKAFSENILYAPVSQNHLNLFYQLIFETPLLDFIGEALGFDPSIYAYRPLRSLVHNQEGVGPQSFHHDGCPPGIYRMLIYLSDVDTNSGPFRYQLINNSIEEVHGCAGTTILFDANKLLHAAKPPWKNERTALDICIGPRHQQSDRFVIAPGMNNWPCDPFHFSINHMVVSPPTNQQHLTFSPYPNKSKFSPSSSSSF